MPRQLYTLSPRLALCAALTRPGRPIIDVGTDHAYLPIWLIKSGRISRAAACDINPGPLEAARRHAQRYQTGDGLRLVLSDGLRQLSPSDGDDIVLAGMGGELILRIVAETPWLRDGDRRLILQPMSMADKLRTGLRQLGFVLLEERAVLDSGKPYSAFSAVYAASPPETGPLYPYMGLLQPGDGAAVMAYAEKVARGLTGRLQGAEHNGDGRAAKELRELLQLLRQIYS